MTDNNYPRVLILGQAFNLSTGGGITLSNLFKGWPKDRLAVAGRIELTPNLAVCEKYYQLGSQDFRLIWPFNYIWPHSTPSGPLDVATLPNFSDASLFQDKRRSKLRKFINSIVFSLGADQLIRPAYLTSEFKKWINDFSPDLIYTQSSSLQLNRLTRKVVKTFKLPYVIHMMDDWPSTLYKDKLLRPYLRWKLNKEFLDLLNNASLFLGISQKMCTTYEKRYQRSCIPFHNPIDLSQWLPVIKSDWKASEPFKIIYRGRIGNAVYMSLSEVSDAVLECFQGGLPVRFDIFLTPACDDKTKKIFERPGCVFVQPPTTYKEIPRSLANADLIVLPYDFDAASIRFIRYSMPTKAPEYMASGTPILVYASPELAVAEYAQEGKWGYLVLKQGVAELKRAIFDLVSNQKLREELGHRARSLAIENHDANNVRSEFRQVLAGAALQNPTYQNKV